MDSDLVESRYLPAALTALNRFPVEPEKVDLVKHSENVTFRVTACDGDLVLRLHRPDYNSLAELESERAWTRALGDAGIAVPNALQTREGEHYTLVDIPGAGEQRYAGVTTWIEGITLADYLEDGSGHEERARAFRWIGAMVARMHNQATRWQEPPGFTRRRLDLDALLGEAPAWGRFWDHASLTGDEQARLLRKRQELIEALERYGERPQTFSLIHADVDPNNIIYYDGKLALIDFDDAAYGWHMYDIALTLDEFLYAPDLEELAVALLDGYRAHRPLAQREVEMLPVFMLIRGMALIGWYHQRPEHRGSAYFEEIKAWVLKQCAAGPARPAPR